MGYAGSMERQATFWRLTARTNWRVPPTPDTAGSGVTAMRLTTDNRLRRTSDFQRVYRQRCSASDERLIVYGRENDLPVSRLGVSVSRKVGPAVVRNRWKRLIRESFRLSLESLRPGIDLVVIPRGRLPAGLAPVRASFVKLVGRVSRRLAGGAR